MSANRTTTALRYASYGEAASALRLEEIELPSRQSGEALLRLLAAPINPADFGRIGGTYGSLASLPATAGLEGVAEVAEIGSATSGLSLGQRVFVPSHIGSWQTHAIARADELFPAPENTSVAQAAMGWVNPATAWKLLHDFVKLQPGDIVAKNAGTSAVASLVIQMARHLGLKTVNLVRSLDAAARLKELGADFVAVDDPNAAKAVLDFTKGKKAKLALNSVGGFSAYGLCKLLEDRGVLVTFGGMDRAPAPFPTRYLIFNDICLRGFWVSKWYENASRDEVLALHHELFTFMENAKVEVEVAATYPLDQYQEALSHAVQGGKTGKILFDLQALPEIH